MKKKNKQHNIFYVLFARIFGLKYQINNSEYLMAIYQHFNYYDRIYQAQYITNISVFKRGGETFVEIETHRPGLLIGVGGRGIEDMKNHIMEVTKQKVVIKLHECKLWHNLI